MANDKTTADEVGRYRVRLSHPSHNKRIVFSSVDEGRARVFVQNRFPRGEEAYLETPDGGTESYQHERQDEYGRATDKWAAFDPETYVPPSQQEAPGQSEWGDIEA